MSKFKKIDISPEEQALFREAMKGVKPFVHNKIPMLKNHTPAKRPVNKEENLEGGFYFSDYERLEPVASNEYIEFSRPGIAHKILRNLRHGQSKIEAILDLHGKTSAEAGESLSQFLLQCQQVGLRYVLIIHGKGRENAIPVLKNKLNNWLRQTDDVIAFCTATPKQGGHGALYVLLRRQR